jgi:hypothetical protein
VGNSREPPAGVRRVNTTIFGANTGAPWRRSKVAPPPVAAFVEFFCKTFFQKCLQLEDANPTTSILFTGIGRWYAGDGFRLPAKSTPLAASAGFLGDEI